MDQNQYLGVVDAASCHAEKIAHPNVDGHLHAVQGTTQHDAFAVKFDVPHAAVGAHVLRIEAARKRERVEPQRTARPGGIDPACCLTPHGFVSPPGLCSRSIAVTLADPRPESLKKAG